jgi:hypothetical protein
MSADSKVSPDVTVTLSALIDAVVYGQRGYSYMQLQTCRRTSGRPFDQ